MCHRGLAARAGAVFVAGLLCLSPVMAESQESGSTTELAGPVCSDCEIVSVPLVRLGDAQGPGMLESDYNIVRIDRHGRYFVRGGSAPYFWVFDGSGRIAHRIGRRGEGPGEFSRVNGIAFGEADSVFVVDRILQRVTVYTSDLELARTFRLAFRPEGPELFVGTSLLANYGIHTADRAGLPFHVLDRDGNIRRSFGSVAGGVYRADMQDIIDQRRLARSDTASFWAARINQYLIERWSTNGRLDETLHRQPPWFEVWWETRSNADMPPLTMINALEQVGDTLWVLAKVPGERWRSAVEPRGRLYRVTNREEYRNTVLEAVDLRRRVVVSYRRMPQLFDDLLAGGLAVRNDTDGIGNPVVWVHRLEIHRPSRQGG